VGRIFILINRGAYWQCGYVIPKGSFEQLRANGLQSFGNELARSAPFAADRYAEVQNWDAVRLLTVRVDRLRRWYRPGLLLIGDAAHEMSPVGGIGINLAIQDAVASANLLAAPLRYGQLSTGHLRLVQRRRKFPTRATQRMHIFVQNRIFQRVLGRADGVRPLRSVRLIAHFPFLSRIPARLIGMGFRPEHVRTPRARPAAVCLWAISESDLGMIRPGPAPICRYFPEHSCQLFRSKPATLAGEALASPRNMDG